MRPTLIAFGIFATIFVLLGIVTVSLGQKHIATIGLKSPSGGCRNKNGAGGDENIVYGGALCKSRKPMKPARALELGKSLCSPGWTICAHGDKQIQRLSWQKTPEGCYAFKYDEKKKAAGYGTTCHTNLYFDGVLCCAANPNHRSFKKKYYLKLNQL